MFDNYDSSFNEYCSFCERRIIEGNGLYCSKDCQLKDHYINANTPSRRASTNFIQYGQYFDPQSVLSQNQQQRTGLLPAQPTSNYHDYSLSAINDANSPTSLRANSNTVSPLMFPSAAHQFYKESRIKGSLDKEKERSGLGSLLSNGTRNLNYNPNLRPNLSPEAAAYWKNVREGTPY